MVNWLSAPPGAATRPVIFPHFDAAEHVCNLETWILILAKWFVPQFVTDAGAIRRPFCYPLGDLTDDARP
jgi:hypothetical protein